MKRLNIDVLVVTETFLRSSLPDTFLAIDGYCVIRRDRVVCRCRRTDCVNAHKGGGILVYIRSSMRWEVVDVADNVESLWIKIETSNESHPTYVNASYHPPSSQGHELIRYLCNTLRSFQSIYPKIFIAGDFNRLDLTDVELEGGLTTLQSPPTRLNAILDLILTNRPDLVLKTSCFTPLVESDHRAVLMHPIRRIPPHRYKVSFLDFCYKGFRNLNTALLNLNFSPVFEIKDVDKVADFIEDSISGCVATAFPIRTITMSDRDPQWMTPKMKWKIKKRKQAKRRGDATQCENLDEKINKAKITFINTIATKSWWKQVDAITHRKITNRVINKDKINPFQLNKDLAKISSAKQTDKKVHQLDTSHETTKHEAFPVIALQEVVEVMQKCRKTSPGPCNIPYFVYKEFWDLLSPPYQYLWNLSLEQAQFPSRYKKANVKAIPKNNNADTVNNIRGISITSIASRMFERIVHKKWITPSIVELGDPMQFGYRPKISCVDCLLTLQHHILGLLDEENIDGVHAILLDFSKAFDRVNQAKAALTYCNFIKSSQVRNWLFDFSINRSQRLIWEGEDLPFLPIDLGCSQGTVGGPNIFSMLTDDLRANDAQSMVIKYSDDTTSLTPCFTTPTKNQMNSLIDQERHLRMWATEKELTINEDKSKNLRFCLNRHPICSCNTMDTQLKHSSEATILGIIFQSDCRFSKHIKRIIAISKSTLYTIKDMKLHGFSIQELDLVFEALILSRIRYGICVYGSDYQAMKKLDNFLAKCYEKGYYSQKIRASDIRKNEDKKMFLNIIQNPKHPLHNHISSRYRPSRTRSKHAYLRPHVRTITFHQSFCNRIMAP